MATTNIMLYVSFDKKSIGYCKNSLEREVGEFSFIKGKEVMIYALFQLTELQMKAFKTYFNSFKIEGNFCDCLNKLVEDMIFITKDDSFGLKIEREEKRRKEERERRNIAACNYLLGQMGFDAI